MSDLAVDEVLLLDLIESVCESDKYEIERNFRDVFKFKKHTIFCILKACKNYDGILFANNVHQNFSDKKLQKKLFKFMREVVNNPDKYYTEKNKKRLEEYNNIIKKYAKCRGQQ